MTPENSRTPIQNRIDFFILGFILLLIVALVSQGLRYSDSSAVTNAAANAFQRELPPAAPEIGN